MFPLVAVDVGNRRIKFGWFGRSGAEPHPAGQLPEPESIFYLETSEEEWDQLEPWLDSLGAIGSMGQNHGPLCSEHPPPQELAWWIGSVNRPAAARLVEWIARRWPRQAPKLLQWTDLPLQVQVQQPHRVGIDRLLNAVAANRLREPDRPAVVVDVGTAITVDWVSAEGAFCGGAILPGLEMAAKALHRFTDLLPEVSFAQEAEPPPALGRYTEAAIRSGLFWGTLGAVRELTTRLAQQASVPPQVFLTGGASALLAPQLGPEARYVPHLTLAGIALSAWASRFTA